jgi:hypothetical protein
MKQHCLLRVSISHHLFKIQQSIAGKSCSCSCCVLLYILSSFSDQPQSAFLCFLFVFLFPMFYLFLLLPLFVLIVFLSLVCVDKTLKLDWLKTFLNKTLKGRYHKTVTLVTLILVEWAARHLWPSKAGARNTNWRGRLSTVDLLVLTSLDQLLLILQTFFLFYKTSYLIEEVNHTEPSP